MQTLMMQLDALGTAHVSLHGADANLCLRPVQLEKYEVVPNQIQEKIVGANASKVAA